MEKQITRRRLRLCLIAPAVIALALAAGCRRESSAPKFGGGIPMAAPMAAMMRADPPGDGQGAGQGDVQRRIAYTNRFVLEMPSADVADAQQKTLSACLAAGCSVENTRLDRLPNGGMQGEISVRIAPDKLAALTATITAPPARLVSHAETADDKTIAVLDIEKRLAAQVALRERLNQLLARANGSVGDLVAAEKQLAEVQGTIESQTAQLAYLHTITDTVRVDVSYNGLLQQAGPFDLSPVREALDAFLATLIGSAGDMITWVAIVLPWLPLGLVGLLMLRWLVRRRT
jgi:hypothetical protein